MATSLRLSFLPFNLSLKTLSLLLLIALVVTGLVAYWQTQTISPYEVSSHAYGRKSGTHAQDETEVRLRVRQVFEWWYNPFKPGGNELFVGLAEPIPGGPVWLVFYNATRNEVIDCYVRPNLTEARVFISDKKYIVPAATWPIP